MASRYNIYYAGEVLEGRQQSEVREKLRTLFKANDAALDKLFSGTEQVVKRECDKDTALKYKQAMERAGARPVIRVVRPTEAPAPQPDRESGPSAAERIAALAAAPDVAVASTDETPPEPEVDEETGWYLEPVGADILRPEERSKPVVADIDISALDVAEATERLAPAAPAPPPAPDTSHLDLGAAGETLPTLPPEQAPLNPNTDGLDLSPEGTDFSDCAAPEPESPAVDLSGMDLAETGSDMVEAQYRKQDAPPAPDTEHISLQD